MPNLTTILRKIGISDSKVIEMVKDLENGCTLELWYADNEQTELLLQIEKPYHVTEHENFVEIKKL